jgi:hypothetical protein
MVHSTPNKTFKPPSIHDPNARMHWNTDRLIDTHELIQTITTHHDDNEILAALPTLQQLLDQVIDDLKGLLDCPAKSDASRQKLQKGKSLQLQSL